MVSLLDALGASSFLAHSFCLSGDPLIIGLYAFHDLLTFVSYATIATLIALAKGRNIGPGWMGFSAFIAMCGLSHLSSTAVLYWGVYRLDVVITVATAWISAGTAVYMLWSFRRWMRPS